MTGADLITAERRRQLHACRFTLVFDRRWNVGGQLLRAAECYETPAERRDIFQPRRLVMPMPRSSTGWWLLALWPAINLAALLLWCLLCHLTRRANGPRL